jgi:hypothetical protein
VPEALVLQCSIFHRDVDSAPQNTGNEEGGSAPGAENKGFEPEGHNPQGYDADQMGAQTPSKALELEGHESDIDLTGSIDIEGLGRDALENMDDDSTSVTSVASHDIFSPAWIEHEALNLLVRIQHDAAEKKEGAQKMVLLSGYGFGGFVVKQV